MKRFTALVLLTVLFCVFSLGSGRADSLKYGLQTYEVTVQGSIFGGAADDRIDTEVSFDPAWMTENDNTVYNGDLAAFAAILSDDVYFRTKDVERGTANRVLYKGENEEEYDWTSLLKEVGFSDVRYIESYKAKEYSGDGNDSATLLLAHTVLDANDLYIVVLRGCFSAQEWISIFDPGCVGETYTELTGEHPEWTDPSAYKGLDIAKNRAMEFIDEFVDEFDDPEYPNCMLITGHSRGGALACMIGAEMEDREDIKSCTYTFNAPGVTTDENAAGYRTVFNIFDSNDFYVDPMPFAQEKFYRYGSDITMPIADSEEVRAAIASLKGRDDFVSMSEEDKALYSELFGERFVDRNALYEMVTVEQVFDSKEEAMARAEACLMLISSESGLGLEGLCYLNNADAICANVPEESVIEKNEGKYTVSMTYCGGAVLIAYAKTLAYGAAAYAATVQLFEEDTSACEILDLLMANAEDLTGGHLLVNSYVLSGYCD